MLGHLVQVDSCWLTACVGSCCSKQTLSVHALPSSVLWLWGMWESSVVWASCVGSWFCVSLILLNLSPSHRAFILVIRLFISFNYNSLSLLLILLAEIKVGAHVPGWVLVLSDGARIILVQTFVNCWEIDVVAVLNLLFVMISSNLVIKSRGKIARHEVIHCKVVCRVMMDWSSCQWLGRIARDAIEVAIKRRVLHVLRIELWLAISTASCLILWVVDVEVSACLISWHGAVPCSIIAHVLKWRVSVLLVLLILILHIQELHVT